MAQSGVMIGPEPHPKPHIVNPKVQANCARETSAAWRPACPQDLREAIDLGLGVLWNSRDI